VAEWRRVARPGAELVFTTPAADGIETLRLIRQAAADHGLALPDPHASLGTSDQIADTRQLGTGATRGRRAPYLDLLDADPRTAYDRVLEYGFADQLRDVPPATADAIYDSYESAYCEQQTAGTAQHVTMFTRCTFSG
jgi:hypothetical protein